jgi:hypothetical protein
MKFQSALLMCLVAVAYCQTKEYSSQHKAVVVNKGELKTIDASNVAFGDVKSGSAQLGVLRDRVNLNLRDAQKRLSAQAAGNKATATNGEGAPVQAVKTSENTYQGLANGKQVEASKVNDKAVNARTMDGVNTGASVNGDRAQVLHKSGRIPNTAVAQKTDNGGIANQGKNNVRLTNAERNGAKTADMNANSQYNAKAAAVSEDTFNAQTADIKDADSRGQFGAKTGLMNDDEVNANLNANVKKGSGQYAAKLTQDGSVGQANLDQVGAGSGVLAQRTTGWKCTAEKDGQSNCVDANGKQVGKVITREDGTATVIDNNGLVKGTGKVVKVSDQEYQVVVSDGLMLATTKKLVERDCYADIVPGGSQDKKVVIENVKVTVDGQEVDGQNAQTFSWPTCFDINADVTIPAGVNPEDLAFEYKGHLMPLGSMKCQDSLTCGTGCYYCDACKKEKVLSGEDSLFLGGNPVCDATGGKQSIKMTVCPPEEKGDYVYCGGFDRHVLGSDYYNYDGSINAQIRVWQRPAAAELAKLREQFFTQTSNVLTRTILISQYKADNKVVADPDNMSFLNWFILKKGEHTLLSCRQGIIDYNIGGSDVNSNIMIDAFTNLPSQNVKLLSDKPCNDWVAQQNEIYATYKQENEKATAAPASSNIFGGLSRFNLFNKGSTGGFLRRS